MYIPEGMDLFIGTKRVIIGVVLAIFLQNSDFNFYFTWDLMKIIHIAFEALNISKNSFN